MADDLEYVSHPTLGQLAFPKDMPEEERQKSIDYAIRQKYGLPEGTDLHAKDPEAEAAKGDRNKYTNAYYEANTKVAAPPRATRGYVANLIQALPSGSPLAIPGISHVRAAYETGMAGVRGLEAARARGEPWYRQAASAAAPLIGLNEEQVRRAAERGDTAGILGAVTPAAALTVLPMIGGEREPTGRAGARETLPRTRALPERGGAPPAAEPLRPLPGPLEGPRRPTTVETLDAATQAQFPGRKFADLSTEQQSLVMRSIGERTAGGRAGEERVIKGTSPTGQERRAEEIRPGTITPAIPIERRAPGGTLPAGRVEQRQPVAGLADWQEAQARSAATGQPTPGETLTQTVAGGGGAEAIPPELRDKLEGLVTQRIQLSGRWPEFKALDTRGQSAMAREVRDEILREQRQPSTQGPLVGTSPQPGAPGTVPAATPAKTVPAAPIPTRLTPVPQGTIPQIGLEEILRQATGQPEPQRAKPGVPLREEPGGKE